MQEAIPSSFWLHASRDLKARLELAVQHRLERLALWTVLLARPPESLRGLLPHAVMLAFEFAFDFA